MVAPIRAAKTYIKKIPIGRSITGEERNKGGAGNSRKGNEK